MHLPTTFIAFSLMLSKVLAAPSRFSKRAASGQNVVYWGQNGGGIVEDNDLSSYCTADSGIDIIVLAFLYSFGNGNNIPSGTIGQSCFISTSGEGQDCDNVASSIAECQAAGIKVILSIGGASGSYSLQSASEAETIGQYLWESYGNSGNTAVQRPFGASFVNGFDFDIELNDGYSQYYQYMISTLRSNFASDPDNKYYITGAPQCPIPEPNMGTIISNSQFDYLWVQWYNNNNYSADPCSLGFNDNAPLNYNQWVTFLSSTPSSAAKIFFGVPAAPLAANGAPSGETYYISPQDLATLVGEYKSSGSFGGVMMWNAGFSDSNVNAGCTYAQEAKNILVEGMACTAGPTFPTTTATPVGGHTSTYTSTGATSTATGTVGQYDQCGGEGYTGPTQCESPYTCVENSVWYSQCE
ncbi:putative endochitinase CHI2 [Mollisia scopiformis]|uniref:chitinase n=1 Tax=Mollisia scopiformis TaxID=149040 RepID=A0A132B213_MOLSC|nr:putative endochitinase CHI2 [Mollisia scopiformis]KUJ06438.1 putative endochitinase CHI2 [Mollisia scopiformis]